MVVWMLAESFTTQFVNFNTKNRFHLVEIYAVPCKPDTSLYHIKSPDIHASSHYAAELDYNIWYILLPYNICDLTSFCQPVLLPDMLPPLPLSLPLSFIKIPSSALYWKIPTASPLGSLSLRYARYSRCPRQQLFCHLVVNYPGRGLKEKDLGTALPCSCPLKECSHHCFGGLNPFQIVFFTAYTTAIQALSTVFPTHCVCKVRRCGEGGVKPLLGLSVKFHVQSSPKNSSGNPTGEQAVFAEIQYPKSTPGHGGFVAAVSQAELKATVDSALTLALAYFMRVQMSFANTEWIIIILCKLCEFHL